MNNFAFVDFNNSVDHVREDLEDALSVEDSLGFSILVFGDKVESRSLVSLVKVILQGLARAVFHLDHQVDRLKGLVVIDKVVQSFFGKQLSSSFLAVARFSTAALVLALFTLNLFALGRRS